MTKKLLTAAICGALTLGLATNASACTRVVWDTAENGTFVSRTMDWLEQTQLELHNIPKGTEYRGHFEHSTTFTSKYDVTGASTYGVISNGVNSVGLSGNALFDNRMDVAQSEDESSIGVIQYLTHLLSQHASVDEAVEYVISNPGVAESIPGVDLTLSVHFSLQDISGDSAIIEFRDGESRIWHGPEYNVMTNQPDYDNHLFNIERAKRIWGDQERQDMNTNLLTGGNINPEDRFVHASYYASHLKEPSSVMNGIMKLDGVVFKVPHDAPNRLVNGVMTGFATEYSITEHLQSGTTMIRYQWGDQPAQFTYNVKQIQATGEPIKFSLDTAGLMGDITSQIIDSAK